LRNRGSSHPTVLIYIQVSGFFGCGVLIKLEDKALRSLARDAEKTYTPYAGQTFIPAPAMSRGGGGGPWGKKKKKLSKPGMS